jgi:hypothetical protein
MNILYKYRNGNYDVTIHHDGTKIRETNDDEFIAEFPDSADIKLTNHCDLSSICVYCHEQSNKSGRHGDLSLIVEAWRDLPAGVELACGGGDTLSHPDFESFAREMTRQGKIVNITCNQLHLNRYAVLITRLIQNNYIKGLGVSLRNVRKLVSPSIIDNSVLNYANTIFHCIAGLDTVEDINYLINTWESPKILILGYKNFGNGATHLTRNSEEIQRKIRALYNQLPIILDRIHKRGGILSFDNLAIEQLNPKRLLSDEDFAKFYQGEDGKNTFYVDAVTKKFARNSTSTERFDLLPSARLMFQKLNECLPETNP